MDEENTDLKNALISWRRHIHRNPELSYKEYGTADYIESILDSFDGIDVSRPTETSVLGTLKGAKTEGPVILLRADIDALPITEETGLEFESSNRGVMHACGHDAHASMLLGAAKELSAMKEEMNGEVRFIFQHAEEDFPGGAYELVDLGVAEGVDYAFALHVSPDYETGYFSVREGAFCAAADDFRIKISGRGGHAAIPDSTIDPIIVGSEFTMSLQTIVSRKISPHKVPVVSVTNFHSGDAMNVIPDTVEIGGTIRSIDEASRVKAREELEHILKGVTAAHRAEYTIDWDIGYPSVFNRTEAVDVTRQAAKKVYGEEKMIEVEQPIFGTEDFSSFSQAVPASMQFIGVHDPDKEEAYPLHHPKFNVDEEALEKGALYFMEIAENLVL
ncbi:amidohydrolase [Salinicoccus halodurans]|uniref:Amidohydrolase n=1 Tax=Salinicoccus halodurans TaxID=407035 RepID=A0A0F7HNI0_9STAP|nr:amidohydrolase [Salinicoccus halodurans]AKG74704.1 N-acyl-L-amino acid amidohydrolase [Salinicoccus halodurans]SFK88264.1 amidohydrolase [Salinicoccus halodurans]